MLYLLGLALEHRSKLPNFRHDFLFVDGVLPLPVLAHRRGAWRFRFFIIILESFVAGGRCFDGSCYRLGGFVLGEEDIGGEVDGVELVGLHYCWANNYNYLIVGGSGRRVLCKNIKKEGHWAGQRVYVNFFMLQMRLLPFFSVYLALRMRLFASWGYQKWDCAAWDFY